MPKQRKASSRSTRSRTNIITRYQRARWEKISFGYRRYSERRRASATAARHSAAASSGGSSAKTTASFLSIVNYSVVADPKLPVAQAVADANNETILMSFPVAAWGPNNETAVIDVGRLFTTDITEFSARQRLDATAMDPTRSFIERVSPLPATTSRSKRHRPIHAIRTPAGARRRQGPGGGFGQGSRECRRAVRRSCSITAWSSCLRIR